MNYQYKNMKLKISVHTMKIKNQFYKPLFLLLAFVVLCSHDLYIKMDNYFLKPNQEATLNLYNGTFEKSENTITRDRILDASILFQGKRLNIDPSQWTDKDSTITQFKFTPIESGTYLTGVSTKARNIELTAEKFNSYLEHDGVLDMLKDRTDKNLLDQDAIESYEKHVKAIYQVGDMKTNDWSTALGYPIEFVPQSNPYEKNTGEDLDVQLLLDGKPIANQLVYADYIKVSHDHDHGHSHDDEHKHSHDDADDHTHTGNQQLRTNDQGMVTVNLPEDGIYYLRTIHMVNVTDSDALTHRSKWATLTFEVTHKHDSSTNKHDDHDHEGGIPNWVFIVGSLLIIGLLFLVFRKKN